MARRVLVTGGAGFIGSHLVQALLAQGARVTVLDDLSTGRAENLSSFRAHRRLAFVGGSVLDDLLVDDLVRNAEEVYHLAAAVGVRTVVEHPIRSIVTNIRGTESVLRSASAHGARVFLASSSEVYGRSDRTPFREEDACVLGPTTVGRWGYGAAKAVDEFLGHAYARERGLEFVVGRLFNTSGPRQTGDYGMVLPRLVAQALERRPLTVYGDGEQTRCFTHVRDVVRAILGLMSAPAARGGVFNIGATRQVTINALADLVLRVTGSRSPVRHVPYARTYEADFQDIRHRVPDVTRLRRILAWAPATPLERIVSDVAGAGQPRTARKRGTRRVSG